MLQGQRDDGDAEKVSFFGTHVVKDLTVQKALGLEVMHLWGKTAKGG